MEKQGSIGKERHLTEEIKRKIGLANKGRIFSEETNSLTLYSYHCIFEYGGGISG